MVTGRYLKDMYIYNHVEYRKNSNNLYAIIK